MLSLLDRPFRTGVESPVVEALAIPEYQDAIAERLEAEREECDWLLTSGALGRSGNLTRVLRYVCQEHFRGRGDQIKEFSIAVEALGRRTDFNPQTDTIVRVTVHALRKRLLEVYQHEGAGRPVHLLLPPGHYEPSFIHRQPSKPRYESQTHEEPPSPLEAPQVRATAEPAALTELPSRSGHGAAVWYTVAVALAAVIVLAAWYSFHQLRKTQPIESTIVSTGLPAPLPQPTIHALLGSHRPAYLDRSGVTWTNANYCSSGTSVSLPTRRIEGTEDAQLYLGGVRGIVHCAFPVPAGTYEAHLHFADTSDTPIATHNTSFSINSSPSKYIDVPDEAGGHDIATSILVNGIEPESDGSIHLDFISEVSLLNAVEILATPSAKQLPVRIVAGSSAFTDDAGQVWASDRYFSGGRYSQQSKMATAASLGLYQSSRIGRFRYNIPAVPRARYRIRLYFRDPWFRKDNGVVGGPGSRIFDVACNGVLLMKDFDILAEGDSKPIVKTFDNVQASADGRIELYFMPVVNYAAVSAIEILPED